MTILLNLELLFGFLGTLTAFLSTVLEDENSPIKKEILIKLFIIFELAFCVTVLINGIFYGG